MNELRSLHFENLGAAVDDARALLASDGKITPERPQPDELQVAPEIRTWPKNKHMR
jgi:hypothetical protein